MNPSCCNTRSLARFTMPVNGTRHPMKLEGESRNRETAEAESDRSRTRDRFEATLAGLGELDFLKHRQEYLVRGAMELLKASEKPAALKDERRKASQGELYLTPEEKQLEDNILMLRKQLNCLRRRDAGLINQLQELDRQISDLQLDAEKGPHDNLETDSRPSSGFYELSDGASGSLSNSSNSVFSECLSSCHSSTCFCGPLDASLSITDGRPKSTEDFIGWRDYGEGLLECQYAGVVRRSFSAPYSSSLDVVADIHPKYQCDLVSKNGGDVYRYPSPLHAVAVQSPIFFHPATGNVKEEGEKPPGGVSTSPVALESESVKTEPTVPAPQVSSCPVVHPSTMKKLDNYILGLLQKKIPPLRPNKPRTSLNTDPLKGILRQGSICVKQSVVPLNTDLKVPRNLHTHSLATNGSECSVASPQRQLPGSEKKQEQNNTQESKTEAISNRITVQTNVNEVQSGSLPQKKTNVLTNGLTKCPVTFDYQEGNGECGTCTPKDSSHQHVTVHEENGVQPPKVAFPKRPSRLLLASFPSTVEERPSLDDRSEASSAHSLDGTGQLVNAHFIPAQQQQQQQQAMKSRKGTKNVKVSKFKSSTLKPRPHCEAPLPSNAQSVKQKPKAAPRRCHFSDDVEHVKRNAKRPVSRAKKTFYTISENNIVGRQTGAKSTKCSGQAREAVLVKPRYKQRIEYRKWRTTAEMTREEAIKRFRRRNRKEVPCPLPGTYLQNGGLPALKGSDSEYSAECESLFHSTVADTSEDEQSNYTTNCFGDSESSLSEVDFAGESTSSSDSDASGALVWPQFTQSRPAQPSTAELKKSPPKAFVKIKASHNLKKKILRFRSGSLKLMTTV